MELERKFLVTRRPDGLSGHPHKRIRQGYLAIPNPRERKPVEVRVRDEAGRHVLTVKGGRGGRRTEVEVSIRGSMFRPLWPLTAGRRIEKVRYRVPLGGLTAEVDVYRGKLRGLITAEVEFASDRRLRAFRPPEWLGSEITGRAEFANSSLATAPGPPRLRKQ